MQRVLKVRLVPPGSREFRDLRDLKARLVRRVHRVLKGKPGRPGHKAPLAHRVPRVRQVQVLSGEAHGTVPQAMRLLMPWSSVAQVMWR